jgi:signal transduction histidine kinase/ligand-binding sensor domain-containing protein/CheY-like chemotaxis protein/AraC-like DNA-binding protein
LAFRLYYIFMHLVLRWLCFCLLFALLATGVYGFKPPVKKIGIEQGLSNNAVNCIYRDHYGFMWMGTYDGLNRYDGYSFKIYRNTWADARTLINNHVNALAGDENNLWVGTQKGLSRFSYLDGFFHPVYYQNNAGVKQQLVTNINSVTADSQGSVYIATTGMGLLVCPKNGDLATRVKLFSNASYTVQALGFNRAGSLWLFIKDVGLCAYNSRTHSISVSNTLLLNATCIANDKLDNFYIGTESGLYYFNQVTGKLSNLKDIYTLTNDNICNLSLARDGRLWVATNGGGVNVLNVNTRKATYLLPGEAEGSIGSGAISAVYEDADQREWLATLRGGVNIIDHDEPQFGLVRHDAFNPNSVVNDFILSFCEDEKKNLWIGTDGGGLSYYNSQTNTYTNYTHVAGKPASLRSNFVVSILKDHANNIWVATFSGGIDLFNKATHTFKHYNCYNTIKKLADNNLWKLYEDAQHHIWAGTTRDGALYCYDAAADKFTLFDNALVNVHALYQDAAGSLWAGNYNQLIKVDVLHRHHTIIPIGYAIRAITDDAKHRLWIGTEDGGLLLFNRLTNHYTRFTEANGLPGNSVLNLLPDAAGNLWLSTYNGLAKFNPDTRKVKNYYASDGLQSNQFNYNAALRLSTGELLFGGIKGFNRFYPDSIHSVSYNPPLKITGLSINNQPLESRPDYSNNQSLVNLSKLTIPFNEASIAVNYSALEYSHPDKILYEYYLEGWDHGWNHVGKLRTAYYSHLNEGWYTLNIRAVSTDGWVSAPVSVRLHVLPPWYRTWWAWLLYSCTVGLVIYRLWLYQTRQTKLKYEVQITHLQAEREKELNEKKLSFFTNISHEFRTPLTLIINPIKDLLHNSTGSSKADLDIIYRNARRLLGLVDHLLLFRKAESDSDYLKVTRLNFTAACNEVYLCFSQQAKAKDIEYTFNAGCPGIELYADREKMDIVLFNLLSNAIKYTPQHGKIQLNLKTEGDNIIVEVSDNGCGIAAGVGEKLFEKYYQVRDGSSVKTGFGIGLYLVKTFIEKHHGRITYFKNEAGGTSFILTLKQGCAHFAKSDILQQTDDTESLLQHAETLLSPIAITTEDEEQVNQLALLISDRQSVLIIDDNSQMRDYIARIFKKDYKIYEAADGNQGYEQIKRFLPDIIISDIKMDGLNGIELCRMIKQDTSMSHIPVILMTGDSTHEIQLMGIEVGAVDFISKPFEKDLLMARVNGILRSKKELQNYFYNEITLKSNTRHVSEEHKDFLYRCVAVIENNIADKDFDVKTIAAELGMGYSTLFKKIKLITGLSVNGFVRFIRIRKAAELLINTNCNVNEAALNVGINDIKYFREHFIKIFGVKPSAFLRMHRMAFHKNYHVDDAFMLNHNHLSIPQAGK